jgi:hypothetical protein
MCTIGVEGCDLVQWIECSVGGSKMDMTCILSYVSFFLRHVSWDVGRCISAEIIIQKDRERAVYGLKEKNLARTYIKLIPLGMRDPDAIRLLHWKKPVEKPTDGEKAVGRHQTQSSGRLFDHLFLVVCS